MERKTILVESFGAPKRIVQQIETKPRTIAACPLCRTRFKKDDPTVLIDLVKRFRMVHEEENEPEHTVRLSICETCAQPVIEHRQEAIDGLLSVLAQLIVDDATKDTDRRHE